MSRSSMTGKSLINLRSASRIFVERPEARIHHERGCSHDDDCLPGSAELVAAMENQVPWAVKTWRKADIS
jgi:hypothetical protein